MTQVRPTEIQAQLARLDRLVAAGRALSETLATGAPSAAELARLRRWQQECAATINQLSGGTKAHWLSRAYSEAFLIDSADAATPRTSAMVEAPVEQIVSRVLDVLARARASLASLPDSEAVTPRAEDPRKPRFDFVRDPTLRSELEEADVESQQAFARGDVALALVTTASVLEAIVTEALQRAGRARLAEAGAPPGSVAGWPFDARLAVAERAGVIRGGCARLPAVAREYRSLLDENGELRAEASVSEREARLTVQVLNVIRRDLAPGR